MTIVPKRMSVELDKPVILFLIGIRIKDIWKIHRWWRLALTMPKILKECRQQKIDGFITGNMWWGRNILMIQYWNDFGLLAQYAKNNSKQHMPIWTYFNLKLLSDAEIGVWHETYEITPGNFEAIYTNMPQFGLAKTGRFFEINNDSDNSNASSRMNSKT